MVRWLLRTTAFATFALLLVTPMSVTAEPIFGLTNSNSLVVFDSATPGLTVPLFAVTGLQPGESLFGIDIRPATGTLYGLGSSNRLYTISTTTGAATPVGAAGQFTLNGSAFGVDFNPVVDRLRVVSNADQNLRLNPDTGTAITDGALNPGDPNVVGVAYANNFSGTTSTTLYDIDSAVDALFTQNPPNTGVLNRVGDLLVNTNDLVGFDISGVTGVAYASLTAPMGTASDFFTINLATGAATLVGPIVTIGGAGLTLVDIAAPIGAPVPEPTTLALVGLGLLGVATVARRRRDRRK